jgi:hypothetical protein
MCSHRRPGPRSRMIDVRNAAYDFARERVAVDHRSACIRYVDLIPCVRPVPGLFVVHGKVGEAVGPPDFPEASVIDIARHVVALGMEIARVRSYRIAATVTVAAVRRAASFVRTRVPRRCGRNESRRFSYCRRYGESIYVSSIGYRGRNRRAKQGRGFRKRFLTRARVHGYRCRRFFAVVADSPSSCAWKEAYGDIRLAVRVKSRCLVFVVGPACAVRADVGTSVPCVAPHPASETRSERPVVTAPARFREIIPEFPLMCGQKWGAGAALLGGPRCSCCLTS